MENAFFNFTQVRVKTQKLIQLIYKKPTFYNDCLLCHFATESNQVICDYCLNDLDIFPLGYDLLLHNPKATSDIHHDFIDGITLVAEYKWPFDQALPQLKFHNNLQHAKWLSELISQQLVHLPWSNIDMICPIPLHKHRLSERGYNQAEMLCQFLTAQTPIRHVLTRNKNTKAQSELSKKGRLNNIKNAFSCNANLEGKRILIVDDVLTTGATVDEAAQTLKEAGAKAVYIAAVAIRLMK